jgi:hypothetical protein
MHVAQQREMVHIHVVEHVRNSIDFVMQTTSVDVHVMLGFARKRVQRIPQWCRRAIVGKFHCLSSGYCAQMRSHHVVMFVVDCFHAVFTHVDGSAMKEPVEIASKGSK